MKDVRKKAEEKLRQRTTDNGEGLLSERTRAKEALRQEVNTYTGENINYTFIVTFPNSYDGLESLEFAERAFNAVYYTFSVMMTYSGNGITARSILSRCIEIVEVICCYVYIATIMSNVIGKASENI